MNLELRLKPAKIEDKPTIENLLELYCYDFSQYTNADVNEIGKYCYKYLDNYWTDTRRFPFLILFGGKIVGFVFVRELNKNNFEIAEFFILRKYRRLGIGRKIAWQIFEMFTGNWQISQLLKNLPAQNFWRNVVGEFTNGDFRQELDEEVGKVIQKFGNVHEIFDRK